MGNGSWIMAGRKTGMSSAFGSSCHGAGRALSRSQAKKMIDGKSLKKSLEEKGIRIHAKTPNILSEEAPSAYKNVDSVTDLTEKAGLARKVARLSLASRNQRMITLRIGLFLVGVLQALNLNVRHLVLRR